MQPVFKPSKYSNTGNASWQARYTQHTMKVDAVVRKLHKLHFGWKKLYFMARILEAMPATIKGCSTNIAQAKLLWTDDIISNVQA